MTLHGLVRPFRIRVRRRPWPLLLAALLIAAGTGGTTLLALAVDAFLFRASPGVADPRRVRWIATTNPGRPRPSGLSYPEWDGIVRGNPGDGVAVAAFATADVNVSGPGRPRRLSAHVVAGRYFEAIGAAPAGRAFQLDELRPDARRRVALISRRLADERGPGNVVINGTPFTVIGIVESPYHGLEAGRSIELWVPLGDLDAVTPGLARSLRLPGPAAFLGLVRGPSSGAVRAWAARAADRYLQDAAGPGGSGAGASLVSAPLRGTVAPDARTEVGLLALLGILGTAGLGLLTSLGVAGLLVSVESRSLPDLAIRSALGAPPGALLRRAAANAVLISLAGTAAGVGLARPVAQRFLADRPELAALSLAGGGPTAVLAVLLLTLTALLACVAPVRYVLRAASLTRVIGSQATATAPRERRDFQRRVLLAQVAVALGGVATVLALAASARRLLASPLGFDPRGVTGASYEGAASQDTAVLRAASTAPGVAAAALCTVAPLSGRVILTRVEGADVGVNSVTPGFFDVLGMAVVAGRPLSTADSAGAEPVAVLTEAAVARFFPGATPAAAIGRRLAADDSTRLRVVGVVADAVYDEPGERPLPTLFRPLAQWSALPERTLLARGADRAADVGPALLARVGTAVPDLPLYGSFRMVALVRGRLDRLEAAGWILGVMSLLGLAIACLGVGATVAFEVSSRRREFGIRQALGADRRRLVREVTAALVRRIGRAVPLGMAIGAAGTLAGAAAGLAMSFGSAVAGLGTAVAGCALVVVVVSGLVARATLDERPLRNLNP